MANKNPVAYLIMQIKDPQQKRAEYLSDKVNNEMSGNHLSNDHFFITSHINIAQ
jgi:hypothetical protein